MPSNSLKDKTSFLIAVILTPLTRFEKNILFGKFHCSAVFLLLSVPSRSDFSNSCLLENVLGQPFGAGVNLGGKGDHKKVHD